MRVPSPEMTQTPSIGSVPTAAACGVPSAFVVANQYVGRFGATELGGSRFAHRRAGVEPVLPVRGPGVHVQGQVDGAASSSPST